jgi:hypothetical protein
MPGQANVMPSSPGQQSGQAPGTMSIRPSSGSGGALSNAGQMMMMNSMHHLTRDSDRQQQ